MAVIPPPMSVSLILRWSLFQVTNQGYTAKPQSYHGFGYMWAGLRANYGVSAGKVAFQMKVRIPSLSAAAAHGDWQ